MRDETGSSGFVAPARRVAGLGVLMGALMGALLAGPAGALQAAPRAAGSDARFVSLKADRVNVRGGPGKEYAIRWVYRRAGLPVQVLAEFEHWRRVRDSEGAEGWVHRALLSGRRTAIVLPWELKGGRKPASVPLRARPSEKSEPVVFVEAGVIANILSCDGTWCHVSIGRRRGWLAQVKLWGVYRGEVVR